MGVYEGIKGETIFYEVFKSYSQFGIWNDKMPDLLTGIDNKKEDRTLVIMYALVIEDALDLILKEFIPGYNNLLENDSFTFSLKISLLKNLKLIPNKFLNFANVVRSARNEFAHQLNIDRIDDLDQKIKNKIETYFDENFNNKEMVLCDKFKKVADLAVTGIHFYIENVRVLRNKMQSEELHNEIKTECEKKFEDNVNEIIKKKGIE